MAKKQKKVSKSKSTKEQPYTTNRLKLADSLEFIGRCERKEILGFLSEIEKRNPSEEKFIKKIKHRFDILWHDMEELRGESIKGAVITLLDLCPQLEKPLREYLKQYKQKEKKAS